MGDFNVARTDADVWDIAVVPGQHPRHPTRTRRPGVADRLGAGRRRRARPGKNDRPFTYWDYRAGMFHKDLGMRIDYVLLSPSVTVHDAYVDRDARKGTGPSDHAPVVVDVTLPAVG